MGERGGHYEKREAGLKACEEGMQTLGDGIPASRVKLRFAIQLHMKAVAQLLATPYLGPSSAPISMTSATRFICASVL